MLHLLQAIRPAITVSFKSMSFSAILIFNLMNYRRITKASGNVGSDVNVAK